MEPIPKIKTFDSTYSLLKEGYNFISNRCIKTESDIFQTKLMLKKAIFMRGEEATKVFYDANKFQRKKAVPKFVQSTLTGKNGVQTLDGERHWERKSMFMSLMTPENIEKLTKYLEYNWLKYANRWEKTDNVVLFKETKEIFCRAACSWAHVPLLEEDVALRTNDFAALVEGFASLDSRQWWARIARNRTERWIIRIIDDVRDGALIPQKGSALHAVCNYQDLDGKILDTRMAAIELINILRPIVAISYYVTFAALAMHTYPGCRMKLRQDDDVYLNCFIQEIRRFYPFAPFIGAVAKEDINWNDYLIKKGSLVFLDIYGSNRHQKSWTLADQFIPERFMSWNETPYNFIPQGGGEYTSGHRCAGEKITIEALKASLNFLAKSLNYTVPEQDLSYSLSRMPTIPKSGFVMTEISFRKKEKIVETPEEIPADFVDIR